MVVTGGRDYRDEQILFSVLDHTHQITPITELAQGGATGADELANLWAMSRNVPARTYPADWAQHGKAAGWLRNQHMLRDFSPDLVIAFPGGFGTADCTKRARRMGIRVMLVP